MMPTIRISETTYERLKSHARPFEDKPEDIIVKALDALDSAAKFKPARLFPRMPQARPLPTSSDKTPQKEFRAPLLKTIAFLGGAASVADIRKALEFTLKDDLTKADFEQVSSGDARWWNAVCWERNECVKNGLINNDGERGVWKLTDKGMQEAHKK